MYILSVNLKNTILAFRVHAWLELPCVIEDVKCKVMSDCDVIAKLSYTWKSY